MRILKPTRANIALAAQALEEGKLGIVPTETVYGLAAVATNPAAVKAIFKAKGRPADNPLIHHVADLDGAKELVSEMPEIAVALAHRFWPGPLSLVLPKSDKVLLAATGGLQTVAIRVPAHPVALSLLQRLGQPLAMPSANPFMSLSPTKVPHIDAKLSKKVDFILDGGPARVGIESTVIGVEGDKLILLRPGGLSIEEIEAAAGQAVTIPKKAKRILAPGQYRRHYAPKTRVRLVPSLKPSQAGLVLGPAEGPNQREMPTDPVKYAQRLFDVLFELDELGLRVIYVQRPPAEPAWRAVMDRLRKAASEAD
ncbi:MAG: threonylcarbamoyl-AMP synthase [Armatimonadetes bacterium]|nr:threonylcarbamoyl-AMP synthase [Armatimonadota bacterium]